MKTTQHIWKTFADLRQRKEGLQWINYDKSEQNGWPGPPLNERESW